MQTLGQHDLLRQSQAKIQVLNYVTTTARILDARYSIVLVLIRMPGLNDLLQSSEAIAQFEKITSVLNIKKTCFIPVAQLSKRVIIGVQHFDLDKVTVRGTLQLVNQNVHKIMLVISSEGVG